MLHHKLNRYERLAFDTLSLALVLFYFYSAVLEPTPTQYHRGIYIIITYILVFLLYKSASRIGRVIDYVLIAASIALIGYWILNFEAINCRAGAEAEID